MRAHQIMTRKIVSVKPEPAPGGGRSPQSTSWRSWPPTHAAKDGEKGALLRREGLLLQPHRGVAAGQ